MGCFNNSTVTHIYTQHFVTNTSGKKVKIKTFKMCETLLVWRILLHGAREVIFLGPKETLLVWRILLHGAREVIFLGPKETLLVWRILLHGAREVIFLGPKETLLVWRILLHGEQGSYIPWS